jgi:hypothetical protein
MPYCLHTFDIERTLKCQTMNAETLANDYTAYYVSVMGKTPNPTNRDYMIRALFAVADANGVVLVPSVNYGKSVQLRRWVSVNCAVCGTPVSGRRLNLEHINNDGHGEAGRKLTEALAKGTRNAAEIQFACANCNQDMLDEAEEEKILRENGVIQ